MKTISKAGDDSEFEDWETVKTELIALHTRLRYDSRSGQTKPGHRAGLPCRWLWLVPRLTRRMYGQQRSTS